MIHTPETRKRFLYTGCGMIFDVIFDLVDGEHWIQKETKLPNKNVLEKILMLYGDFHQTVHNLYQTSVSEIPFINGTSRPNPKCVLYNYKYFMKTLWEPAFITVTGVLEMIQEIHPDLKVLVLDQTVSDPKQCRETLCIKYRQFSVDEFIITGYDPKDYGFPFSVGAVYTKGTFDEMIETINKEFNYSSMQNGQEDHEKYQPNIHIPKKESATVRMTVFSDHREVTMDDLIVLIYKKLSEDEFVVSYYSPVLYHDHFITGHVHTKDNFAILVVDSLEQVAAALYNAQIEKTEELPGDVKVDEISQQSRFTSTDIKRLVHYSNENFPDFHVTVFDEREIELERRRKPITITYRNTFGDKYIVVNATPHFPKIFNPGDVHSFDEFHEKVKFLAKCHNDKIKLSKIQNNGISGIGEFIIHNPPVFYAELDHGKSNKETVTVLKWNGLDMQSLPFESYTSGKPYCYIQQMALHVGVGQNLFVYRDGEMSLFKFRELTEIMDRMNADIVEAKRKVGTFNFHGCIKSQEN